MTDADDIFCVKPGGLSTFSSVWRNLGGGGGGGGYDGGAGGVGWNVCSVDSEPLPLSLRLKVGLLLSLPVLDRRCRQVDRGMFDGA